ncbi:MAG: HDOD domain-containing protein [Rhodocyclaceae bacterium]|nr:HDOD domain-containing protein [Rhodocyclaceae bacterium]
MSADPSPTSRASSQRKARELVANVATELRLPPDIVALRRILDDANATPEQLIETLGRLPALTGRLLELIELPLHRQESDAWTLPRMVHQLGAQRILDLALVVMVSDGLARIELATERCGFWPLAVRTALVSRGIARQCGRPESDRSMVAGLLMPTGLALLWHADPAGMQRANQILEQEGTAARAAQRAATGTDCVAVTTALARQWQLPTPIQRALACCDEPARAVPHHFEAAVLRLAQSACDFPGAGEPPDPLALSLLNLTPACVHTVAANTELYYQAYLDFMARRTYPPSTASDPDPVMPAAP